uniref:Helitron helicase-like domain-containing protein n=1 Tax=Setaria viridis TaxID=4556 RepID=A0A4U6U662_SETVI|nr:hypothetical protein SEVIR_6G134300v2 [Setaria viridis]
MQSVVTQTATVREPAKEPNASGLWEPDDPMHGIEDVQYEYHRDPNMVPLGPYPYDGVYNNLPRKHHVLKKVKNCEYCNVTVKVLLSTIGMGSFRVSIDRRLASTRGIGVYTFKAYGQIYHKLDPLVLSGKGSRHMQLYIYDTDDSIAHRVKRSLNLDENLIHLICGVLIRGNPYVQLFTSLGTLVDIQEYMIELNTKISVDQRRYNALAMDQIAAIWVDGNDPQHRFSRSIVIYGKSNDPHYIRAYHDCYDPLAYPLFCGSWPYH